MRPIIGILYLALILFVTSCTKEWDDHYNKVPDTINTNVWDAIKGEPSLSKFAALMEKFKYDTLFQSNDTYTIFAPDNNAIDEIQKTEEISASILNYHISTIFIQPVDIQGSRKLQTLDEKYSTFENVKGNPSYDGIALTFESPLYMNGKFFIMGKVARPKLNLYEYYTINNPYLKAYIDKQDSIIIDKEKSRPIGFDEMGNTVYDTVSVKVNLFEEKYFPISEEFRAWTATYVFPRKEKYENALTEMATKLGGKFHTYQDIPVKWQEDVLIPYLVDHGTFLNSLEVSEFKPIRIKNNRRVFNMLNIVGDSIIADYIPTDRYLASNGISYDYSSFVIPDSLFSGAAKYEGEWLARQTGANKFAWRKNVVVNSTSYFDVSNSYIKGESNDSILVVNFAKGYKGTYSLQFKIKNLFPRKYRMIVHTHMDIGGIYEVYINDVLVKSFDYYDYVKYRGLIKSVTGATLVPVGRYNSFDCWVDNITEYGQPTVRFEYKGPGNAPNNGLVLDVIEFIPAP
ncbi:MAG: fasciclin domain-containing protein [Prolixibacteraceae bacterium]